MARLPLSRLIGAFVLLTATSAQVQDVTVYDDALQNGFQNYSCGAIDAFVTSPTHLILDINGYFAP